MLPPATSGYTPVNGLRMYYEIYGEGGTPIVLIHGGGSTIESSFGNLLPLLTDTYRIIAVELQAHGRTSDRDAPESFQQDADDVAALLRYLGVDEAHILGFSNGGSTALQLAIRHPRLVAKIIVIAGAFERAGLIPGLFEGLASATVDQMPEALKAAYLKVNADPAGLQTMFEKDKARMLTFEDWPVEALQSIAAPALLISADKYVVLPEHALRMSQLIPGAQLAILPGVHGACIGEAGAATNGSRQPEITALLIREFLNGLAS